MNSQKSEELGRHFTDGSFKCFFLQCQESVSTLKLKCLSDKTLQLRHNGRDSVSNHQPQDCLLNRLFRRRSKKAPKLRVTGLSAGNSPGTSEFPAQMASYTENVSIWWRHHVFVIAIAPGDSPSDGKVSIWRLSISVFETLSIRYPSTNSTIIRPGMDLIAFIYTTNSYTFRNEVIDATCHYIAESRGSSNICIFQV